MAAKKRHRRDEGNLSHFIRNNPVNDIDVLGLLPGSRDCVPSGKPPVDSGWKYAGYTPDDSFVPVSSGQSTSSGVDLVYRREIKKLLRMLLQHKNSNSKYHTEVNHEYNYHMAGSGRDLAAYRWP